MPSGLSNKPRALIINLVLGLLLQCKLEFQSCLSGKAITLKCDGLCPCLPGRELSKPPHHKNEKAGEYSSTLLLFRYTFGLNDREALRIADKVFMLLLINPLLCFTVYDTRLLLGAVDWCWAWQMSVSSCWVLVCCCAVRMDRCLAG